MQTSTTAATPSITDWITAVATISYTLLTFGLVIFTLQAWKTAKAALEESRKSSTAAIAAANAQHDANVRATQDGRARTRPYVYVQIAPGLQGPLTFDLRIVNAGRSLARRVLLNVGEWPGEDDDLLAEALKSQFNNVLNIPPQTSVRLLWRKSEDGQTWRGMQETVSVAVSYEGITPEDKFNDEFEIRCTDANLWPIPECGNEPKDDLTSEQAQFYSLLQTIARRIGELTR